MAEWITPKGKDIANSEVIFEKDITEAVGFQNGYKPWLDILPYHELDTNTVSETECGMLGLITTLFFIEKIE